MMPEFRTSLTENVIRACVVSCYITAGLLVPMAAAAAQSPDQAVQGAAVDSSEEEVVNYAAEFFQQYEPDTALNMVEQLPGFQIDDGDTTRGFGGSVGNILINGRRPSAKQDRLSAILGRIPASIVERIELIRGQIRGLDIQGHSVLANVILHGNAPAAIRWDSSLRKHSNVAPLRVAGSISISDRWQAIDYSAGVSGFRAVFGDKGTENVFDGNRAITERRFDNSFVVNHTADVYLSASTWLGGTLLNINTSLGFINRDSLITSHRIPEAIGGISRDELFGDDLTTRDFEVGVDAERSLSQNLVGKAIFLLYGRGQVKENDHRITEMGGFQPLFRVANSKRDTTEAIARLEFDWTGWTHHAIQANFEVALNGLDNTLLRTDDTGVGPIVIDVPGANARIEEVRGDVLLQDTWSLGQWTLNYGLGAETSTISQSGDANQESSFFFLKPQGLLILAHSQTRQTRLRLAREVAQLNFSDFVSATVFLDDDLALGNPDLKPESTWVAELTHERRLGGLAVVSLTFFHHWISDVQDLLPMTSDFEAPGNIGDGQRWGLEMQATVPLEWAGLTGARLDIDARWQDSSVTDPVTGEKRVLTAAGGFTGIPTSMSFRNENAYAYSIAYRQDFQKSKIAWGWSVSERGQRPRFKVNELDIYDEEGLLVDVFVETTRWGRVKIGLEINNLLDLTKSRERHIYSSWRSLSGIERRVLQQYSAGRRYILSMSGSF